MSFGVQWESICDICGAPLDISIHTDSHLILSRLITYSRSQPLDLTLNKFQYKSNVQRKLKRICIACNSNISETSIDDLAIREIYGTSNIKKCNSVTMSELHDWFRRANRCIQDDDCNWSEFFKGNKPTLENVRLFIGGSEYNVD